MGHSPVTRSSRSRSRRFASGGATCTSTELDGLAEQVAAGETDPYAAADRLLEVYAE